MRRWLATAFGLTLALFGIAAAIAAAGDVFAIFGTRLFPHNLQNLELRLTTNGDRVIKGLEYFRRTRPLDVVFLGSSRVVFGFDPHSATMSGLNAYNAGLNGSHSNESATILTKMAGRDPKVARVIWAIDFEEFFREEAAPADLADSVFGGASPWRGRLMHALSYEGLRKTIGGVMGAQAFYIDTDGFYHYALQDKKNLIGGEDFWELPSMRAWFPSYMFVRDTYAEQLPMRLARIVDALRVARAKGIAVDVVLPPVHVSAENVIRQTVGLRPHRPSGFVLKDGKLDAKTLIHNYGHGGSGMSLSWGTATMAADMALAHTGRRAAVLGSGVVGLTTARQLQRRGFAVTIYAEKVPPDVTSNFSLAGWTPTSGLVEFSKRTPEWGTQLVQAAEIAYRQLQFMAGNPRYGISWGMNYSPTESAESARGENALLPRHLQSEQMLLQPGEHPFPTTYCIERPELRIAPNTYLPALMEDVLAFGGQIVIRKLESPKDVLALSEPLVVNCTGLGAKALFGDEELMPLKGLLVLLPPQEGVHYSTNGGVNIPDSQRGLFIHMMPRPDGIVLVHISNKHMALSSAVAGIAKANGMVWRGNDSDEGYDEDNHLFGSNVVAVARSEAALGRSEPVPQARREFAKLAPHLAEAEVKAFPDAHVHRLTLDRDTQQAMEQLAREQVIDEMERAGYRLDRAPAILPYQYVLIFSPR